MKTFVFGIGGTGARVLRSLTLLLASGVECKSDIVPIIIDPDINKQLHYALSGQIGTHSYAKRHQKH